MSLWDRTKSQLRSVIEWENSADGDLFYRWSENGDEIKNASKLLIGPGQGAIFVYEGKVQSVLTTAGIVDLKTGNIPFVTTLIKFMQAFESEHKVSIYFFRTTKIVDLKWGTPTPVKYMDPVYKFPIELRAFGNYSIRITDARNFFINVIGKGQGVSIDEVRTLFLSRFIQPLTDLLATSGFSYIDIDANRDEIAKGVKSKLTPELTEFGFVLEDFRVSGTNFDEDTKERIGRISDLTAEASAAKMAGVDYIKLQQLDAMKTAAANEGGIAGMGVGMGAGLGLGQMMAGGMAAMGMQASGNNGNTTAQPAPEDPMLVLGKLKKLLEAELISQEDFDTKKKEVLARL